MVFIKNIDLNASGTYYGQKQTGAVFVDNPEFLMVEEMDKQFNGLLQTIPENAIKVSVSGCLFKIPCFYYFEQGPTSSS